MEKIDKMDDKNKDYIEDINKIYGNGESLNLKNKLKQHSDHIKN